MWKVEIPEWVDRYTMSKASAPKYWEWKDLDKLPKKYRDLVDRHPLLKGRKAFCATPNGERFLKNTKSVGKPKYWILNGQDLYSAVLNWRQRKTIAEFYHKYFQKYIEEQLTPIELDWDNYALSISCDIYEIKRGQMPDVSNMWLLEKFFEDALQEVNIIPDDNPDYVLESGRKRYHWVNLPSERKLIFNINILKLN